MKDKVNQIYCNDNQECVKIDNAILYNQDCLKFLKNVKSESIDCVLIDEPYGVLTGHKIEEGYNLDIALQVRIEVMRVLKKDGWFIFFSQFPVAWDFGRITMEAGFKPWQGCNEIVWCKRAHSSPFGKIGRIHENIFVFQKGNPKTYENKAPYENIIVPQSFNGITSEEGLSRYFSGLKSYVKTGEHCMESHYANRENYNDDIYRFNKKTVFTCRYPDEMRLSSIWSFSPTNKMFYGNHNIKHPTVKPTLLLRRLIKLFTKQDDLVLDCFLGSGSTAVASLQEGRQFIGCERDKTYFDNSIERIKSWREDLKRQDEWLEKRGVEDFTSDIKEENNDQPTLFN